MRRKILIFSFVCFLNVLLLVLFEPQLNGFLEAFGKDHFVSKIFILWAWVAILGAFVPPFLVWMISISEWYDDIKENSVIYGKRNKKSRAEKRGFHD